MTRLYQRLETESAALLTDPHTDRATQAWAAGVQLVLSYRSLMDALTGQPRRGSDLSRSLNGVPWTCNLTAHFISLTGPVVRVSGPGWQGPELLKLHLDEVTALLRGTPDHLVDALRAAQAAVDAAYNPRGPYPDNYSDLVRATCDAGASIWAHQRPAQQMDLLAALTAA